MVVWLALILFAWSTAFREARQFSDGQMTAVAKLWLSATPYRLEPRAAAEVPDLQHEYLQDVAVVAWDDGRLVADTHGMVGGLDVAAMRTQGFATVRVKVPGLVPEWRAYSAQATLEGRVRRVIVLMDLKQRYELGKDIAEHVALPALLVLPYRYIDQSGVLFQALRFGTPVLATRVGQFEHYVTPEVGELAEPGAAAPLREALLRWHARCNGLSRARIREIGRAYEWPATVQALRAAYH